MTTLRVTWDDAVLERARDKLIAVRDAEPRERASALVRFGGDQLAVMATIDALRSIVGYGADTTTGDADLLAQHVAGAADEGAVS